MRRRAVEDCDAVAVSAQRVCHDDAISGRPAGVDSIGKLYFLEDAQVQRFDIHTDASNCQLGGVISQNGTPIALYSPKITPAQSRYIVTEKYLLNIVKTLKEFRTILLGQGLKIYTDHKNLTLKNFNTDRVLLRRLILEEYSPDIEYIQGEKNMAADALSRLPSNVNQETAHETTYTTETTSELYDI